MVVAAVEGGLGACVPVLDKVADESPLGDDALLTIEDVAQLLRCSARNVHKLRLAHRIVRPRKVGALVRWRLGDLKRWIATGCPRG